MLMLFYYFMISMTSLISVAFLTLMERKILSYIQLRKGPNKIYMMGILQPISDAMKLFLKSMIIPVNSDSIIYFMSSIIFIMLPFILYSLIELMSGMFDLNFGMLFFMSFSSLMAYPLIMTGWSSNSKYALMGSLRSVAQMISYEVGIFLLILSIINMVNSFKLEYMLMYQMLYSNIYMFNFLFLLMFISSLAEMNRTPFDFVEGESEIVSGYNVEYGGVLFAMLFLGEYLMIILNSYIISTMFFGSSNYNVLFFVKVFIIIFIIMMIRGVLPRFRYDMLMMVSWKNFLPLILLYMFISMMINMINF